MFLTPIGVRHGVSWTLIFGGTKQGGARILVRGGNIEQNFIHEFLSSPVLQWCRQNFGYGGNSAKMYSSKTIEKFEKFIKNLHINLKYSPKYSKIKFNRI